MKHLSIHWVDGMKINKDHFIGLENAFQDQIQDSIYFNLNDFNYGLLPEKTPGNRSLEISFHFDGVTKQATIQLLKCRAVTPGGVLVEISEPELKSIFTFHNLKVDHDIILRVDPYEKVPVGQPNPNEIPLRFPHTVYKYNLEIAPHRVKKGISAFQLNIGLIKIENEEPKLFNFYVPPCAFIVSNPYLSSIFDKFTMAVEGLELVLMKILQKANLQQKPNKIEKDMAYVVEKLLFFIAGSKDSFQMTGARRPPIFLVEYCKRLVRVFYIGLESSVHKVELLDYYCKIWMDLTPGKLEVALRDLLNLEYDHENILASYEKVEECSELILAFFNQVWEITSGSFGSSPGYIPENQFGWLIARSKDHKREIMAYPLTKNLILIGRSSLSDPVDIDLAGDGFVSRKHAHLEISEQNGETLFNLVDLDSTHGSFLISKNKGPIQINRVGFHLKDNDFIQLGQTQFVLKTKQSAASKEQAINEAKNMPYPNLYFA
ncbi:hypothetical protein BH23BAC1_BH23BAC1_25490 [soil metagenome]